jgi:acyl-CoA synthetase (AMP-forming)/AMP-acid ligase II
MPKTLAKTLICALKKSSEGNEGITYITSAHDENTVTYQALYQHALGLLHHLQQANINTRSEIIICIDSNEQFVNAFWASLLGALVPVPLATGNSPQALQKIFNVFSTLKQPYLYTNKKQLEYLRQYAAAHELEAEFLRIQQRAILIDTMVDISTPGVEQLAAPEDIALIQYSSGSTGTPKGIMLSHKNLLATINAIVVNGGFTWKDIGLSWLPLTHDLGLVGFHLLPTIFGRDHHLLNPELFIRHPKLWLQKAHEKRASVLASPNFGYHFLLKHITKKKLADLDLSCVRVIFNGAEPISMDLCREFSEALSPYGLSPTAIFPVYGMAEAGLAVTFPDPCELPQSVTIDSSALKTGEMVLTTEPHTKHATELALLGMPVQNCQVRITDQYDNTLTENHFGFIQIKGENVTSGYYGQATTNTFTDDDWLKTNDMGFFHNSQLVVTGRANDLIIINGQSYWPHDIEASLFNARISELGKVVVCGINNPKTQTETLVVFIAYRGSLEIFADLSFTVRSHLLSEFSLPVESIIPVKQIPKTSSGKFQRFLLKQQFTEGKFAETCTQLAADAIE